jgi:thiosulfate/3-mercaptopyruvate sulfurtransferase
MKKLVMMMTLSIACILLFVNVDAQNPQNWIEDQLMQPAQLASILSNKSENITIISVGPFNTIPNTISVGMTGKKEGLDKLKAQLASMKKDTRLVIYCGCCPFEHCPNVRPAIDVLKAMKFTHFYLLNLPDNIKINWIDKGYPVIKS